MNKKALLVSFLGSIFLFSGCSGGDLFSQSVQKTAPKFDSEVVGDSFAPVSESVIEPFGTVLTTQESLPLYTYSKDKIDESNCYGDCAIAWPPLAVELESDVGGLYGVIQRADGILQVTYNGQPLYTYTPDSANVVTGDGKDNEWAVVVLEQE